MSVIPSDLDTDQQPPMTVPLRHFIIGLGFLLLGGFVSVSGILGFLPGLATLAHLHLLLAGWVCMTIMGAMTQFVPVWSGTQLHSRRFAVVQLWFVAGGLTGFAATLIIGIRWWLPLFGSLMLVGFWVFAYNLGRTLVTARPLDTTERHFALALGFFVLLTTLGLLLAIDFIAPVFAPLSIPRDRIVMTHATIAVFGAVLTTIIGALYQLATMFTQTKLHGIDVPIQRFEEVAYPIGVVALALGRLLAIRPMAQIGGMLVIASLLGLSVILVRRLYETQVDWTPMLSRYAMVVPAIAFWASLAIPAWITAPLSRKSMYGASGTTHLLLLGVIGFVVLGTLYHIIPFVIWVHRYSDVLGYEKVPMIDDLYDSRLATIDFVAVMLGTAVLVLAERFGLPAIAWALGGIGAVVGFSVFFGNMLLVIHKHSPHGIRRIIFPISTPGQNTPPEPQEPQ